MSRAKMITFPPGEEPGGATPFERFDNLMRRILSVSKEEVNRRIATNQKHSERHVKKRRKPAAAATSIIAALLLFSGI